MDVGSPFLAKLSFFLRALALTYQRRYHPFVLRITDAMIAAASRSLSRIQDLLTICFTGLSHDSDLIFKKSPSVSPSVESFTHESFCADIISQLKPRDLGQLSRTIKLQLSRALQANPSCMLPSFNHLLPQGDERGTFLALDVGGSTFRVALVELLGEGAERSKFLVLRAFKINNAIKQLRGTEFFDWMAMRIEEVIAEYEDARITVDRKPLWMGLAWSFPVEQTSLRSGKLQGMGKGFLAAEGLIGQDLGLILQQACERRNLDVSLRAIVNDSASTLLSSAYIHPQTRFGLILGTGVNSAAYLPVHLLGPSKFGARSASWHEKAKHVIVNTELSMFGSGALPFTRWDSQLNAEHILPDFQPLEYFVGGRYLGEIARLILVEGVRTVGLFGGIIPPSLKEPYSLDTALLAGLQTAATPADARALFDSAHPSLFPPSDADTDVLRLVATDVTRRASAVLAAAIHALWEVQRDGEAALARLDNGADFLSSSPNDTDEYKDPISVTVTEERPVALEPARTSPPQSTSPPRPTIMAYNGSVIESYPGFRASCQAYLDELLAEAQGVAAPSLELVGARESSLLGAAVAVAVALSE